jgi:hypothetical protein
MSRLAQIVALAWLATASVVSATAILSATGTVTSIGATQGGNDIAPPPGVINIGDTFTLWAMFDLSQAELTSLFDDDPTMNIYGLPGTIVRYSIGAYAPVFPPLYNFNASTQLWNDQDFGGPPIDSQSFSFLEYDVAPVSTLPFDLGDGEQSVFLDLYAFDPTATARSNDLISDYAPLSAFASRSFSFGQFNSDAGLYVFVQGDVDSWTVSPIPEPEMWGMMIVGLGAVGSALRRRKTPSRVASAAA